MTTELMLIGIKCQTLFNNWMGSFPVKWEDLTHQFIYKRHPKHLKFFYFHVFVIVAFFNAGCIVEVVVNRLFYPRADYNITELVANALGLVLMAAIVGLTIGLIVDGEKLVVAVNAAILHLRHLRQGRKHFKKGANRRNAKWAGKLKELLTKEDSQSLDMIGLSMLYFSAFSLWFPPLLAIFCLALDINPMKMAFNDIFSQKVMSQVKVTIPAFFFYIAMYVLNSALGIRLIQVVVILATVPSQIYIRITSELEKMFERAENVKEFEKVHLEYAKFKLINLFIIPVIQKEAFVMMQVAKWASVYCIFAVLKFNSYLEPVLIGGHVAAGFAIMITLGLSLPFVSKTSEVSEEAIKVWNDKVAMRKNQYLKRKYKAMIPIQFFAGLPGIRFCGFDKSTTSEFFTGVVDTVIDLLIGYPDEDIKRLFRNIR